MNAAGSARRPAPARETVLVISCEHGGREVPSAWASLFSGSEALLETHRGWDPGALQLGRQMADALGATLHAATTTRLLIDLNRSIGHRGLFSEFTRGLPADEQQQIVERHYRPHRDKVEQDIARHVAAGRRVVHVASHSFTPSLDGEERHADVGWLYDPRRAGEVSFARDWMLELARSAADLRLRRNYPYRGRSDGLASLMRKRHGEDAYVGIELEVNQRFPAEGGAPWVRLRALLVASLVATVNALPLQRR